jgi:hypothetical protein
MKLSSFIYWLIILVNSVQVIPVNAQLASIGYGNYLGDPDQSSWLIFPEIPQTIHQETSNYPWSITISGGVLSEGTLGKSLTFNDGLEDSYSAGIGVNKRLINIQDLASIEADGQFLKHFGEQNHLELTSAIAFRWRKFPWNDYINTTLAVGEGLSWATEIPKMEDKRWSNSSQLLNYLLFEFTLASPEFSEISLVFRVHHRSGVFGVFDGVKEGSNLYNFGIRYELQ